MPPVEPPRPYLTQLRHISLSAGHLLWRVTPMQYLDDLFRTDVVDTKADGQTGGRFDPTPECLYPYTYVALDPLTAIAETLLRNAEYQAGGQLLPRAKYRERAVSVLEPTRALSLVTLSDLQDLAAARQDTWLVHADAEQYPLTRRWGHWFRECSERADGLIWPSKRNPHGRAILLFGDPDRCGTALRRAPFGHRRLDTADGEQWLAGLLKPLYTYLKRD